MPWRSIHSQSPRHISQCLDEYDLTEQPDLKKGRIVLPNLPIECPRQKEKRLYLTLPDENGICLDMEFNPIRFGSYHPDDDRYSPHTSIMVKTHHLLNAVENRRLTRFFFKSLGERNLSEQLFCGQIQSLDPQIVLEGTPFDANRYKMAVKVLSPLLYGMPWVMRLRSEIENPRHRRWAKEDVSGYYNVSAIKFIEVQPESHPNTRYYNHEFLDFNEEITEKRLIDCATRVYAKLMAVAPKLNFQKICERYNKRLG